MRQRYEDFKRVLQLKMDRRNYKKIYKFDWNNKQTNKQKYK